MTFLWTEEAIERLKALHAQGLSGSELAARLGAGLTRSAIFGKLHRLGLTGGKSAATQRQSSRLAARNNARAASGLPASGPPKFNFARVKVPRKRARAAAASSDGFPLSDGPLLPPSLEIGILDIHAGQCRFIAGEGGLCCGHPVLEGSSWCPAHFRLVFAEEAA